MKNALIAIAVYGLFLGSVRLLWDTPISRYLTAYNGIHLAYRLAEAESVIQRELPYRTTVIDGNLDDGWVRFEPISENYNADYISILMVHRKESRN